MKLKGPIQELLTIEDIEKAEARYEFVYGQKPFLLSTWNPSEYYRNNYLLSRVPFPSHGDFINYIYSYELDANLSTACREKIAGSDHQAMLLTNSGTASISLVTSVLSALDKRRILVVSPTYFAVFYNCLHKGFRIREVHYARSHGSYRLPRGHIINVLEETDVLWLTAPIYNTSVYLGDADLEFLQNQVLPHIYVVADECFCGSGRELSRILGNSPHFIGIYDPMKQFLINGAKFSAVMFSPTLEDAFCNWPDIICGGLTSSTIQALEFFLSQEADRLLKSLQRTDRYIHQAVYAAVSKFPSASLDIRAEGHMMMCYIPALPSDYLQSFEDFCSFQQKTGTSIIPGTRFHFPDNDGFVFRINLARYDPICFERSLNRVLTYLSDV